MSSFFFNQAFQSNVTAYPQSSLHRSSYYRTMFDTILPPPSPLSSSMCYTSSKGTYYYRPHTAYGMVGTSASAYLGRRRRL